MNEDDGSGGIEDTFEEDRALEASNSQPSNLELRLGISSTNRSNTSRCFKEINRDFHGGNPSLFKNSFPMFHGKKTTAGLQPWPFPDLPAGFIDPWSLAARQQKAVLEQAHQKSIKPSSSSSSTSPNSQSLSRENQPRPPSVVGWPPVCSFRRSLVNPVPPAKLERPEMDGEREAKRLKVAATGDETLENNIAMFVKVNMEGYSVGRKIDIRAHGSYDSLSSSLKNMFNNFLSRDYSNSEEDKEGRNNSICEFLLIYEDHEGDRMIVGDVPWEIFIASVKRLYIVRSLKPHPFTKSLSPLPANMDKVKH